jgi:hypothetical protein
VKSISQRDVGGDDFLGGLRFGSGGGEATSSTGNNSSPSLAPDQAAGIATSVNVLRGLSFATGVEKVVTRLLLAT